MTQPNKENIRKWVNALRSGEYSQTKGALGNQYGYCCLGIACEAAIRDGLKVSCDVTEDQEKLYDNEIGTLPTSVQQWLGVDNNPVLSGMLAAEWNDVEDKTFVEIADLIEKEYLSDEVAS